MCYQTQCGPGNTLQLNILGQTIDCPTGQTVDLATAMPNQFKQGSIGPCPDNAAMCGYLSCNESCTVGGLCRDGKCYCNLQYTGTQCAQKLLPDGNYTQYTATGMDNSTVPVGPVSTNLYVMVRAYVMWCYQQISHPTSAHVPCWCTRQLVR